MKVTVTKFTSGHLHTHLHPEDLARRHQQAKRCSTAALESKQERHLTRLKKRSTTGTSTHKNATYIVHGQAPTYDFLKDNVGILTPEVSDGPYVYPESQLLRQDITGSQVGVPLVLDIGVLDVNTCSPMSDVLVNIWVCSQSLYGREYI